MQHPKVAPCLSLLSRVVCIFVYLVFICFLCYYFELQNYKQLLEQPKLFCSSNLVSRINSHIGPRREEVIEVILSHMKRSLFRVPIKKRECDSPLYSL